MRNVHSKKSLAAVVAKTTAEAGGAGTGAKHAAPASSSAVDGPRVVVHRPEARDKVDVSQLPYMHRNPAV